MIPSRQPVDQNPFLLLVVKRDDAREKFCRIASRLWDTPNILVLEDVRSAILHVLENRLEGRKIRPDIVCLDLEAGGRPAKALFETIRAIVTLRHVPLVALIDSSDTDLRDRLYDDGADLVVPWPEIEARSGDIAGLAVSAWLSVDPDTQEERQQAR